MRSSLLVFPKACLGSLRDLWRYLPDLPIDSALPSLDDEEFLQQLDAAALQQAWQEVVDRHRLFQQQVAALEPSKG